MFSIFYSFIRLFANKRIEYKTNPNKIFAIFVNTNKDALIRLFDYLQLKIKQEKIFNKNMLLYVFTVIDLDLSLVV